jgi:hypothetical protein
MMGAFARLLNRILNLFGVKLVRHVPHAESVQLSANRFKTEELQALADEIERLNARLERAARSSLSPVPVPTPFVDLSRARTASQKANLSQSLPRELTSRCLFVVGNARSGTTILNNCLNQSRDIFMMSEANFYLHLENDDFVEHYNRMHSEFRNPKGKDSWIPLPPDGNSNGVAALLRLAEHYRWIGEKIAFGPHGKIGQKTYQDMFFEFHSRYFYDSTYLLLARKPNEVIFSLAKMFPNRSTEELIETWIDTITVQLDVYSGFPNAQWIFFEDLSSARIVEIADGLKAPLVLPENTIRTDVMYSKLPGDEIHPSVGEFAELIVGLNDVYRELRSGIAQPHVKGATNVLFRRAIDQLTAIRQKLESQRLPSDHSMERAVSGSASPK